MTLPVSEGQPSFYQNVSGRIRQDQSGSTRYMITMIGGDDDDDDENYDFWQVLKMSVMDQMFYQDLTESLDQMCDKKKKLVPPSLARSSSSSSS